MSWLLTPESVNLTFFWLAYRNINHTFLHALKPLNKLVTLSLTHFSLWRHHWYLVCCILSRKIVTCTWLVAFQPLSIFFVTYFVFSSFKYIRRGVFLSLNPLNRKLQFASCFKTSKQLRYSLLPLCSPQHINETCFLPVNPVNTSVTPCL